MLQMKRGFLSISNYASGSIFDSLIRYAIR